jgi:hypothetical protein
MRIQRRKHALHCRRDQIVVAGLVLIHVILANQFESFCKNRNLQVPVIFFAFRLLGFLCENARESAEQETSRCRNDHESPHI